MNSKWSAYNGISFKYYNFISLRYSNLCALGDQVMKEKFNELLFWFGAVGIASFGLYMSMVA